MEGTKEYLLALDGGTGSFRAILFDKFGHQVAIEQIEWEHPVDVRYQGSIGFDFEKDWEIIKQCLQNLLTKNAINPTDIKGISSDSMREGFVLYDENQKELIGFSNIDARAKEEAVYLKRSNPDLEMDIYLKTGQTFALSALPRLLWVKNHEPEIYEKTKFINMINDWIIYKLTGKIVSEPSNSSTSGLFNLKERKWLPEVAQKCGLKSDIFPPVFESGEPVGYVTTLAARETGLSESTVVVCGGGDSQLGCIGLGSIKNNQAALFGGSFWQYEYNTDQPYVDVKGRVRVNCHAVASTWQQEAIAWSSGLVMRWFRDAFLSLDKEKAKELGVSVYALMDGKAKDIPVGCYGMASTFADVMNFRNLKHAAPTFTNFMIDPDRFNKYTFYKSIMENAGLITLGHLKMVKEITGYMPDEIFFAGGSAYSSLWSQIIADILGIRLITPKEKEATALGAAFLAGVGSGVYQSLDEAIQHVQIDRIYEPNMKNHQEYLKIFEKWQAIYKEQLTLSDQGLTDYMWIAAGAE
ncbi:autoinducer 2 kinase LsrK [Streptococcus sp. oral taxon 056 str. F0418]|uniref:autoinducer-2 kinase n=1 Tax=Streptococcus sp. oral taxon 056 TaxID=712620 RepID=UPI0002180F26|nr:autoinducer-2 kinase [Streptococcus sp. oral taxon 056]EGP66670.1 autoinducer 2 kinase LsrK [Streptococcus sp. oral taxon 056 str. F0418]